MPEFVVRNGNGECHVSTIDDEQPTTPGMPGEIVISAPVGERGRNLPHDTRTIQEALNRVPREQGGPLPPLMVDGRCGPKTKSAIQKFQLQHFGWKGADSRVDPSQKTLAKLNEVAAVPAASSGAPMPTVDVEITDPAVEQGFQKIMGEQLDQALRWIKAAQFELMQALPVVDQRTDSGFHQFRRERLMRSINLHFGVDHLPDRRGTLLNLLSMYDNMERVFKRPGGVWGKKAFELYKGTKMQGKNTWAFTWYSGFYHGGEMITNEAGTVRQDTIFLMPSAVPYIASKRFAGSGTIIHELAHFVGDQRNVGTVMDHGYGPYYSRKVEGLPAAKKIRNAENYANFATYVGTGTAMYYQWT